MIAVWYFWIIISFFNTKTADALNTFNRAETINDTVKKPTLYNWAKVTHDVTVENYFDYIDALVAHYDSLVNYPLTEHVLIRANPWIIDTLANTDYYRMIERDSFVYDQGKLIVLRKDQILTIPDSIAAAGILDAFEKTVININIPEFKLRIYQDTILVHTFPIRVGKNEKKYLSMGDRITNLRTISGEGKIIAHQRYPDFYDPVDGKKFYFTKRDDEKTTRMPKIPWIETEINGTRNGQMIHPTTNPKTLGKAYSNGCIGTRESDAWIIYYYAPMETHIKIRYDLKIKNGDGKEVLLKDIYGYGS